MEVIVTMTAQDVLDSYKDNGLSEKRRNRAQATNSQMPKSGTFSKLAYPKFKNEKTGEEVPYPVLVVVDKSGKEIGNIAIGTILQQISTGKARQVRRATSEYVNKWFHAGRPLSEIAGLTEAEQVANLIGKSFTTKEMRDQVIGKLEFDNENKVIMYATEAEAVSAIDTKDCYKITVID